MKFLFSYIFLLFTKITLSFAQNCKNDMTINIDINCFNEVLYFNSKNYRAGHFAINNKGDMIVEYSDERSRLFYGLKKNGRYFFETENNIKEIENIQVSSSISYYHRYESNNIFIYLEDDINKEKPFLFSTSCYTTVTELHDFENNNFTITTTRDFMKFQIYGFVFSLLEAKVNNKNIYFCIFNHGPEDTPENGAYFSIIKFGFKSFKFDNEYINEIKTENYNRYNRIVNGFIMEEDNIIVVFYMDNSKWYNFNFYDFDLNLLAEKITIGSQILDTYYDGIFFKGIYLQKKYSAIMYFLKHNDGKTLHLEILEMKLSEGNYGYKNILKKHINQYDFSTSITMNEFLKINNERLVYISTTKYNYNDLYILFFDLYNNYTILKTRLYHLYFYIFKLQLELSACIYNNFLVFTGTAYYSNNPGLFSVFLMFGFPKGKDKIIDISLYLSDSEVYNPNMNLVKLLLDDLIIDNNLFGYEKVDKIRLSSIPKEIIFYNNINLLPLIEGDIIDENYRLLNNIELVKENKYYELEYQFIVKEQNYSEFYKYEVTQLNYNDTNYNFNYTPLTYFGRTNIIKFKLCNNLCETCKIYGVSNINQKCLTCSFLYDYNYFTKKPLNCLPQGYFQDNELENIMKCNSNNSKFYYDIERNKTICFKYDYDCPYGYSNFNQSNNECILTIIFNTVILDLKDSNYTNDYIISSMIPNLIENFNNKSNVIVAKDNFTFQITSIENEINSLKKITDNKNNLSIIDIGDCENTLRIAYDIDENIPLIILKSEKVSSVISEKALQYEIYNSLTKEKLDLSICDNQLNVFYPISLDDKKQNLLEDLNTKGYDIFDIDGDFYKDICTPYKNENGTDVLLTDRMNDIYDNSYSCPSNCKYSSHSNITDYLTCECAIENKNISVKDISNLVINSFKNVFKTLNYKFVKCYKLVFHVNVITKNYGSIICIILFCLYIVYFILYIIKGRKVLEKDVDDHLKKLKKRIKKDDDNLSFNKEKNPNESNKKLNNTNIEQNPKRKNITTLLRHNKRKKVIKGKKDNKNEKDNDIDKNETFPNPIVKKRKRRKKYTDYELNNLKYEDAIDNDKRSFFQIYLAKLKKEHVIMFTFFAKKDFNLIYVKIAKFILEINTNLAMNALFFFDESMHKIYLNYGKYDLIQQIPQIIYSSLISQIINIIISYLIITEKQIHEIIDLKQNKSKKNSMEINKIIKSIEIRFIIFFSLATLLFAFYWYFISAFCAVYENTQIIFLKDFISSFFTSLLYPFIIYLFFALCRFISLKDKEKKRLNIIYKISNL